MLWAMESIKEDPDLAAEMVRLLGRELMVTRKKIEEFEHQGVSAD